MMPSISVLIPLTESRRAMFEAVCLPSIVAPFPIEILIDDANEPANVKRNRLARSAKNHYFFFCDDDVILAPDALKRLYDGFGSQLEFSSFAYGDFMTINHPTRGMGIYHSRDWDMNALRLGNYISTMSLVRADAFPGFDETLDRFQDWDLWLTIAERGGKGVHVGGEPLFAAIWNGDGITKRQGVKEAMDIVRRKHGL